MDSTPSPTNNTDDSSKLTFNVIQGHRLLLQYDYLLVINCQLSSISRRFRDIASRSGKPPQPNLVLRSRRPSSNLMR